jgi:hypothetical protein
MANERTPRRRLVAAALLAGVIGAGLAVHVLLPDIASTDVAGDALYAAAVYLATVIVTPRLPPLAVAAIAAVWGVAVELFQLTGIPLELGAAFPPSMLVLGTVFDARDLVVYVVSTATIGAVDVAASRRSQRERLPN